MRKVFVMEPEIIAPEVLMIEVVKGEGIEVGLENGVASVDMKVSIVCSESLTAVVDFLGSSFADTDTQCFFGE